MTLPRFKAADLLPGGSTVTTGFGWDIGPKDARKLDPDGKLWPRIHHAVDRVGPGDMTVPVDAFVSRWIPRDGQGCSVIRLMGHQWELRILHANAWEVDRDTMTAMQSYRGLKKGARIGPCGNTGLSFGKDGGRHVHYSFMVQPGFYEDEIIALAGHGWDIDKRSELEALYGERFVRQCTQRGVSFMNETRVRKWDALWGRELDYLNTEKLFEGV